MMIINEETSPEGMKVFNIPQQHLVMPPKNQGPDSCISFLTSLLPVKHEEMISGNLE